MNRVLKIGTRQSQLAVWQARHVQQLLLKNNIQSELVFINSDGDTDTVTPLYELGIQGIFTKSLDAALINNRVDIAVHSLKDVPTKLAEGICQAAVLKRASCKDILVINPSIVSGEKWNERNANQSTLSIATSSIRRKAQWLHRYPNHEIHNLRGNVNTRLQKVAESNWYGAIFAAAGLERIGLRPQNAIDLNWMLPAPAQGAITISCREEDEFAFKVCNALNDAATKLCTQIERDFLGALLGGCTTPISALAIIENDNIHFKGNVCSPDGRNKIDIEKKMEISQGNDLGIMAANEFLQNELVRQIIYDIRNDSK